MSTLFKREVVVIVGTARIEKLRVSFKVHKDSTAKPNTAEVIIYNLAQSTRAMVQVKGTPLIVQAGYAGSTATIFSGEVRTAEHTREGADWKTTIRSGDGEKAFKFATLSRSYRPGTPMAQVLKDLLAATGLDVSQANLTTAAIAKPLAGGFALHGRAFTALGDLLGANGFEMSVQDGKVQVLKRGDSTGEQAILLSPTTGLLGSPTHGTGEGKDFSKKTKAEKAAIGLVKFKSLLQPGLRPGRKVVLDSEGVKGTLRILTTDHTGDTNGGSWTSDCDGVPV